MKEQPSSSSPSSSINISGLLGIAFIVLKLCGVITFSWWWVTLPFWGPLAFLALVVLPFAVTAFLIKFFGK